MAKNDKLVSRIWKSRSSYLMLAPFLIFFFMLLILPILMAVVLSFTSYDYFNPPVFVGFDNFISLFVEDSEFVTALQNTLLFAVISGPISYLLCFFLAWVINDRSSVFRSIITFVFYAPSVSGSMYAVWTLLLSSDRYGIVNGLLLEWGLIQEPLLFLRDSDMILGVLIVVQLWMSLGNGFLAFIAGFQMINRDLFEVGAIDGIQNRWQELWYITLPQMKPMLLFGAITQIVTAFSVGDISLRLCGFPSINNAGLTLSLHAYDYANLRYEMGYGCAITTVLFLLMLICNRVISSTLSKLGD